MIRKIIKIEEEKCNGCGLCANACQEGAIAIINNKAKLVRDDYCDGLGNCLPVCPTGAISFVEREAEAFDEEKVKAHLKAANTPAFSGGCPGSRAMAIKQPEYQAADKEEDQPRGSELRQWPVQIKLAPVNAPYFSGANLLIAADCTAYAYGNFHQKFIRNHITLIGCPKLDDADYSQKLTEIIKNNDIKSVKVIRMEVPCCGGIEYAVKQALINSGKMIPWQVITISTDGRIINE